MITQNYSPSDFSEKDPHFSERWKNAIEFFRSRSPVVFLSPTVRFWERHGFVQQSLARTLSENGVSVKWIDGAGWRRQPAVVEPAIPGLEVSQLHQIPGRRFSPIQSMSSRWEGRQIQKVLQNHSKAFVWVYGGIDDALCRYLPAVDVFSVFDDPYRHRLQDNLCQKSKVIFTQNSFALDLFSKGDKKCERVFPPFDLSIRTTSPEAMPFQIPRQMPQRAMGYIGAFHREGFDFVMFETFVKALPDWTFILCGKTDAAGEVFLERLKRYPNFLLVPWRPRENLGPVWQALQVSLLLYRPTSVSDGAFPVKYLESLHYGVPSVATSVPKTKDLEGFAPRSPFTHDLIKKALAAAIEPGANLAVAYEYFAKEMDPKYHLIRAAEAVQSA